MEVTASRKLRHLTNKGAIDLIRAIQSKKHEIRSIDDQIAKLVATRESCNTFLSLLCPIYSPIAPITRLPPKLLAQIFVLAAVKEFESSIIPVCVEPIAKIP
ncbi:hypothetical protein H0H93_011060 [Arthromyces matolae]|nr:hypothetical protein H0H93_011060 [Arthromyces matolae]